MKDAIYSVFFAIYHKFIGRKHIHFSIRSKLDFHTKLEGYNKIGANSAILNSVVGRGTYIGWNSILSNGQIGRFCTIAPFVECIVGTHPLYPFVSIHPAFYSLQKQAGFTFVSRQKFREYILVDNKYNFIIGNDVWIGRDVKIFGGITIGDGAIVATGSIVTKDIPPFEVWGGSPAKKIKDRFPDEIKGVLIDLRWWEWEFDELQNNSEYFDDIDSFIKRFKNKG